MVCGSQTIKQIKFLVCEPQTEIRYVNPIALQPWLKYHQIIINLIIVLVARVENHIFINLKQIQHYSPRN